MRLLFCLFFVSYPLVGIARGESVAHSEIVNCVGNLTCGTSTGCRSKETALTFVVIDDDRILVKVPGLHYLKETKSIEDTAFFYWEDSNIVNSIVGVKDYTVLTQIISKGNNPESFITELQCEGR